MAEYCLAPADSPGLAPLPMLDGWYTVADVCRLTGWDKRRVQRQFARWQASTYPRVEYRKGAQGNSRGLLVVHAAEYHAVMRGALSPEPVAA